jgi:hypothetical protein
MVNLLKILLCFFPHSLFCQDFKLGERKGFLQTTGAIYPTFNLNTTNSFFYLNGHLTCFLEDHFVVTFGPKRLKIVMMLNKNLELNFLHSIF